MFAAHAMAGVTDELALGFNFELFTHVTRFCGRKVVLLGLYNGQGLQDEPEQDIVTYARTTEVSHHACGHAAGSMLTCVYMAMRVPLPLS